MNRREFLRALFILPIAIPFIKLPEIEAVEQATLELNITSPNLTFRHIGQSMAEGLEKGLANSNLTIIEAMQRMVRDMKDKARQNRIMPEYTFIMHPDVYNVLMEDDYVIDWNYPD